MSANIKLVEDCDDLDDFTGVAFALDDDNVFTIKHYKGSAPNVFTVYLPRVIEAGAITELVHMIIRDFQLPESSLKSERSRDPDF